MDDGERWLPLDLSTLSRQMAKMEMKDPPFSKLKSKEALIQQQLMTAHFYQLKKQQQQQQYDAWRRRQQQRDEDGCGMRAVFLNGIQKLVLSSVEALNSANFCLNMIATRVGVQKISGITLYDAREKKIYDPLPDVEIFVDTD